MSQTTVVQHCRACDSKATVPAETLAQGVVTLLALVVIQRIIGFVRSLAFCRLLDPAALGRWDLSFAFLLTVAPLAVLAVSGSFRRYVEHYNRRGQLRWLLKWSAAVCLVGISLFVAIAYFLRGFLARLVLGDRNSEQLITLLIIALPATVGFHFLFDLFSGMRQTRTAAVLQLVNSAAFALLGVAFVAGWHRAASSVILAYALAGYITCGLGLVFVARRWPSFPQGSSAPPWGEFFRRVMSFAVALWFAGLLASLFAISDRYIFLHLYRGHYQEALALLGQYHAARILPLLLVGVTELLATVVVSHLVVDHESGNDAELVARLNCLLKLFVLAVLTVGTLMELFAPLLFTVLLGAKYSVAARVFSWTVSYCALYGVFLVLQTYSLCYEKAGLGNLALAVGVFANIALNMLLVPSFGLLGAIVATTAAHAVVVALMVFASSKLGWRPNDGVVLMVFLPLVLSAGVWISGLVALAVLFLAAATDWLLLPEEKRSVIAGLGKQGYGEVFVALKQSLWPRSQLAAPTVDANGK